MISEVYIWIWLPGEHQPVVCGKLEADNTIYSFVYGRSYLARSNAIALDPFELPLQEGVFSPSFGETHSVIRENAHLRHPVINYSKELEHYWVNFIL